MKLSYFTPFPPGEFPYSQTVKGITYNFPSEGLDINTQATRVQKFRAKNGFPRSTFDETLDDISEYTCQRLGNNPKWCGDSTRNAPTPKVQSGKCGGCGAPV